MGRRLEVDGGITALAASVSNRRLGFFFWKNGKVKVGERQWRLQCGVRVCIPGQSERRGVVWGTQAVSTSLGSAAQWRELRWEAFVGWRPSAPSVPAPAPFRQYLFLTLESDYDVAKSKICKALAP